MSTENRRGERRDRTWRYGRRAQRVHVGRNHPDGGLDCICERSVWFFRKRKSLGCRCRGKKKGAPKLAGGMCSSGYKYRPTAQRRIWNRRLASAWLARVGAGDLGDIELPGGPIWGRSGGRRWSRAANVR